MRVNNLNLLACPKHNCGLSLRLKDSQYRHDTDANEIRQGILYCDTCNGEYPIIDGVAILVPNVTEYLVSNGAAIRAWANLSWVPPQFLKFLSTTTNLPENVFPDWDLENPTVLARYLIRHFARRETLVPYLDSRIGECNPATLIDRYWDPNPYSECVKLLNKTDVANKVVLDIGCSLGRFASESIFRDSILIGLDTSFSSIYLARDLHLTGDSATYEHLLQALFDDFSIDSVTSSKLVRRPESLGIQKEFIVGDVQYPPFRECTFDLTLNINLIDMISEPHRLPAIQDKLTKNGGLSVLSSPFLWIPSAKKSLAEVFQCEPRASQFPDLVHRLYEFAGFKKLAQIDNVPWLFYKQPRVVECYSCCIMSLEKISGN